MRTSYDRLAGPNTLLLGSPMIRIPGPICERGPFHHLKQKNTTECSVYPVQKKATLRFLIFGQDILNPLFVESLVKLTLIVCILGLLLGHWLDTRNNYTIGNRLY